MLSDIAPYLPATLAELSDGVESNSPTCDVEGAGSEHQHKVLNASESDVVLLAEMVGGSRGALALLFCRYRSVVLKVAKRILKDESEAEDLCQEVFIYVFQRAKLFDAKKGTPSSWIIQIAYHRAINRRQYLARRQHYDSQEFNEERIDSGRQPLAVDQITAKNLLNKLRQDISQEQMQTLELHFFEGYSLREIAEKTNQTLGNVRHHYYRSLERLRSNLFPKKDSE